MFYTQLMPVLLHENWILQLLAWPTSSRRIKEILALARQHSYENAPEHLKDTSFQGTGRPHPGFFRP